jgi:molecular chaperone DnaK (HSP70)
LDQYLVAAYFNHAQRAATLAAADAAGFDNVSTIAEPTAAAMAYGLFVAGKKTVLVFDFGASQQHYSFRRHDDTPEQSRGKC